MLASVDPYLQKRHMGDAYNCLHFARDVWLEHTGKDIGSMLQAIYEVAIDRRVRKGDVIQFERLDKPEEPCLVMFRRKFGAPPHIGVYLRGKVLHLTERGARHERLDLAQTGFIPSMTRYYR